MCHVHLSGKKYMGLWQRILCVNQILFLCLLGIHLDSMSTPSWQLSDIMSLGSGLQILAEVMCPFFRLVHKITLRSLPWSLLPYSLGSGKGSEDLEEDGARGWKSVDLPMTVQSKLSSTTLYWTVTLMRIKISSCKATEIWRTLVIGVN